MNGHSLECRLNGHENYWNPSNNEKKNCNLINQNEHRAFKPLLRTKKIGPNRIEILILWINLNKTSKITKMMKIPFN